MKFSLANDEQATYNKGCRCGQTVFHQRHRVTKSFPSMRIRPLTCVVILVTSMFVSHQTAAAGAEDVLQNEFALTKSALGNYWLLASERRLRESITKLLKQRSQVIAEQRALADYITLNAEQFQADAPLRTSLKRQLAKLASDDQERTAIATQLEQLNARACSPDDLIKHPAARRKVIHLMQQRSRLTIATANLRRSRAAMMAEYGTLADTPAVTRALKTLGSAHRLGPAQDYRRELTDLDRPQRTNFVLAFEQSGHVRLSGIINDRVPLTFSWSENDDVITVPQRIVASAKIDMDNATSMRRTIGDARNVAVKRVRIDHLRFGNAELRGVMVDVLPPDAEHIGARIGWKAIDGYVVTVKPKLLRVTFKRSGEK